MTKTRLEAFSDGVIAILITIMVLELKVPHGTDWAALRGVAPTFLSYVLSYVFLGIYWNNHHHMLHLVERVDGRVLWANLHLLFWLSLVSFSTGWMGENHFAPLPTAIYGFVLWCSGGAYLMLQHAIVWRGHNPRLRAALGKDPKGKASFVLYLIAIPLAFVHTWIAHAIYVCVALIWLVPDRRVETKLEHGG
jgi:uncharacterized membrane protein